MSTRAWGSFKLASNVTIDETKTFSFQITKIASENLLGIKLGWNVFPDFRKEFEGRSEFVPFELIDSPLSDVAHILFSGDVARLSENKQKVDSRETLDSRMNRVQTFILEVFKIKIVEETVLHIDSGFGEEQYMEVKANDFTKTVLGLYTHGRTWEPSVKFTLKRDTTA